MNANNKPVIRIAEADESIPKIDFALIDRKYKEWLIRRGFASEDNTELGMRRSNGRRGKRTIPDEI